MVVIVWRIAQHRSVPSSEVSVLDVESSPKHPDNGKENEQKHQKKRGQVCISHSYSQHSIGHKTSVRGSRLNWKSTMASEKWPLNDGSSEALGIDFNLEFRRRIIWQHGLETFVQKIVVRTDDFQLAYRIMHMLRSRNIDVEQRSLKQPLPSKDSIWIGTVDEIASKSSEGRPIAADLSSIEMALEAAIFCAQRFTENTPVLRSVLIRGHVLALLGLRTVY